jgi:hypothetical protein
VAAARGQADDTESHLQSAVSEFRGLGYRYWEAVTQLDLARCLIGLGRSADAAALLDDAVPALESLSAAPAVAVARELRGTRAEELALARPSAG